MMDLLVVNGRLRQQGIVIRDIGLVMCILPQWCGSRPAASKPPSDGEGSLQLGGSSNDAKGKRCEVTMLIYRSPRMIEISAK